MDMQRKQTLLGGEKSGNSRVTKAYRGVEEKLGHIDSDHLDFFLLRQASMTPHNGASL